VPSAVAIILLSVKECNAQADTETSHRPAYAAAITLSMLRELKPDGPEALSSQSANCPNIFDGEQQL